MSFFKKVVTQKLSYKQSSMNIIISQEQLDMGTAAGINAAASIRKAIKEKGTANII